MIYISIALVLLAVVYIVFWKPAPREPLPQNAAQQAGSMGYEEARDRLHKLFATKQAEKRKDSRALVSFDVRNKGPQFLASLHKFTAANAKRLDYLLLTAPGSRQLVVAALEGTVREHMVVQCESGESVVACVLQCRPQRHYSDEEGTVRRLQEARVELWSNEVAGLPRLRLQ